MTRNPVRVAIMIIALLAMAVWTIGCGGSGGSVVPPPPPPPPQPPSAPSVSPASANAPLGGSANFTVTGTGTKACTVGMGLTGTMNGDTYAVSVPTTPPTGFPATASATVSCTASNSGGTSSATTATINLQWPVPTITSVIPSAFSLDAEAIIGGIQVNGSGFYPGGVLHNSLVGDLVLAQGTSPTQLTVNWGIGSDIWKPGWVDQSASSPSGGPGGGTSATKSVAFLGNMNSLTRGVTQVFQLQQGGDQFIRPFNLDGSAGTPIPAGNLGLDRAIGHDNLTNFAVVTQGSAIGVFRTDGGITPGAFLDPENDQMMGVAARGGWVCATQPAVNKVVCADLAQLAPGVTTGPLLEFPVPGEPWNIAMTNLQNELVAIIWSRQDRMITLIKVDPSGLSLKRATAIGGLFQGGQGVDPGRWQLSIFESGPMAGHVALLSQSDNTLVLVNIDVDPMLEVRRVTVPERSFRIGARESNGTVIVAVADPDNRETDFLAVDSAGTITVLALNSNLLATGLAVSPDGTTLFVANRDQLVVLNLP